MRRRAFAVAAALSARLLCAGRRSAPSRRSASARHSASARLRLAARAVACYWTVAAGITRSRKPTRKELASRLGKSSQADSERARKPTRKELASVECVGLARSRVSAATSAGAVRLRDAQACKAGPLQRRNKAGRRRHVRRGACSCVAVMLQGGCFAVAGRGRAALVQLRVWEAAAEGLDSGCSDAVHDGGRCSVAVHDGGR